MLRARFDCVYKLTHLPPSSTKLSRSNPNWSSYLETSCLISAKSISTVQAFCIVSIDSPPGGGTYTQQSPVLTVSPLPLDCRRVALSVISSVDFSFLTTLPLNLLISCLHVPSPLLSSTFLLALTICMLTWMFIFHIFCWYTLEPSFVLPLYTSTETFKGRFQSVLQIILPLFLYFHLNIAEKGPLWAFFHLFYSCKQ